MKQLHSIRYLSRTPRLTLSLSILPIQQGYALNLLMLPAISSCASLIKKLFMLISSQSLNIVMHPVPIRTARTRVYRKQKPGEGGATHLYHKNVGPTVPKCHKLCASTLPPSTGAKSNSSKLIASTIHATAKPGHVAQPRRVCRYLCQLYHPHSTFCTTPHTTFAAMLYV